MRIWTLSLAVLFAGVLAQVSGRAYGGPNDGSAAGTVQQAGIVTIQDDGLTSEPDEAGFAVAGDERPRELPADPAYVEPGESPFIEEQPPAAEPSAPARIAVPSPITGYGASCGGCYGRSCGGCYDRSCGACRSSCGRICGAYGCCPGEPLPLFYCPAFNATGFRFGGWVDHGVSVVANSPFDRYNGVVTFNDRDAEYQMNQLWTYLEKAIDPCRGFDIGGRIDFLYGTDARFTQAVDGLEANWDQTEPFYQAALPQFYLDAAVSDWTFRIGHFFTPIGYEGVPGPGNFFYSHSYTFQYGEPRTHTGFLLMHDVAGGFSFSAGLQRGINQFDDTDGLNSLGYLGSVTWTNQDGDITTGFAVSATEQGPGVETLIYSLVSIFDLSDRLTWVLQHDYGRSTFGMAGTRAQWYGVNQYFLYEINCCLSAGLRWEWFHDEDGTRVRGLGEGNLATGPFVGDFYELTLGLNWRPHGNITVRPEIRWDWFDEDLPGPVQPYDSGQSSDQFMFGCDMIVLF
jgi:hypothetical protein